MFQTALFLLCSVAVLHSGAETVPTSSSIDTNSLVASSTENTNQPTNGTTIFSSSVTPIPTETTSVMPTPTTTPTPVPTPEIGKWIVNETNETCIIVKMAVQFNVTYITTDHKSDFLVLDLPVNETQVKGVCGASKDIEQNITISWLTTPNSTTQNNLTLHFRKNITKNQYSLHDLQVDLAPENFPYLTNSSMSFEHRSNQFTTGLSNSYRCLKIQTLNLTKEDNKTVGEIKVSNLQFQAFHSGSATSFGFAEDCAFDTPDIVPIAVGCALALLVVIVLIAYLVGRRRSQARGYLSM
ncbi:lysosome-associated membrane glycoprotein 1 [Neodiprion lecontei]|uniref:Lysosome-associated membrane glycoprotein 5 n=1 Tax=Neodiprion lecontei TaxID=441921 RepID=A0A6J0C7U7_NEOLC|nr:lysosome-associated membrane glycoprotein 1 [Neodiprion lecontei]